MDTIAQVSWMSVSGKFYSLSIININFVSAYLKSLSGMHELVLASELLLKGCVGFLCACANTYFIGLSNSSVLWHGFISAFD